MADTVVASYGNGTTVYDLFNAIDALLTGPKFATGTAWTRVYTVYGPTALCPDALAGQLTSVIYKGVGDGADKIYVGMRLVLSSNLSVTASIEFNGYAGYDANLNSWIDQPGAITKLPLNLKFPSIVIANNTAFSYWITATTKRFIIVNRLATWYTSSYVGFFKPVSVEKQYPYPLVISGTVPSSEYTWDNAAVSSFTDPVNPSYSSGQAYTSIIPAVTADSLLSSFKFRKVDGTWGAGANNNGTGKYGELNIWPTNCESTEMYSVYVAGADSKDEPHILMPFMMYSNWPTNVLGQFDGIYWVGGSKDIASEDIVRIGAKDYVLFSNVLGRGGNDYYALEWE